MNLSISIVGLPNVGKSTLFNALLKKQQALAANYPFATIEPNVGIVPVPDFRLEKLAEITQEEHKMSGLPPIKPATVEFYDIAGLVKGASEGEGLGNKFLSHIRETKIIAHVVRAFEDADVIKEGAVDPKSDYEVINTELIMADLATAENVRSKVKKFTSESEKSAIKKLVDGLNAGKPARDISFEKEENDFILTLFLLSNKPEIVVLNVSEADYNPAGIEKITAASIILAMANSVVQTLIPTILSSEADERSQGAIMGLNSSYQSIGMIIGPIIGGVVASIAIPYAFLTGAAFVVICYFLSFKVLRAKNK